jgi:hypothetical protein
VTRGLITSCAASKAILYDHSRKADHRLFCGSALENSSYQRLLGIDRAQMVFTDPPYNVPILGHVSGCGAIKHREFAMASGEQTDEQFTEFLSASLIYSITGHKPGDVRAILTTHYLPRDSEVAGNAIAKLNRYRTAQGDHKEDENPPTAPPTALKIAKLKTEKS